VITISDLHTYRGLNYVLQGVDLEIGDRQCTALLGRNGMGKTTLVQTIMGLLRPRSGTIRLDGRDIAGRPSFVIARQGVALVPQGRRVFPSLSVEENLTLGARTPKSGRGTAPWTLERIYELFPNLGDRRRNRGSQLSGGEQQMLAIARALLTNPKLLLMDEPSEGLAPVIVDRVGEIIAELRGQGLAIFLVEQNYRLAIRSADTVSILANGVVVWRGAPAELDSDPGTREAHLGVLAATADVQRGQRAVEMPERGVGRRHGIAGDHRAHDFLVLGVSLVGAVGHRDDRVPDVAGRQLPEVLQNGHQPGAAPRLADDAVEIGIVIGPPPGVGLRPHRGQHLHRPRDVLLAREARGPRGRERLEQHPDLVDILQVTPAQFPHHGIPCVFQPDQTLRRELAQRVAHLPGAGRELARDARPDKAGSSGDGAGHDGPVQDQLYPLGRIPPVW
jgi:branched-chain amino acid transport system ATP-binding protein